MLIDLADPGLSINDDGQEIPKEFEADYDAQEILMKKCQHCGVYPGQYHAKDCPQRRLTGGEHG